MSGNVWEWCEDVRHDNYNDAPKDGSAWTIGGNQDIRMVRGGSWDFNDFSCTVSNRGSKLPNFRYIIYGLCSVLVLKYR
jgi:formylglycine-generating enzyme required for sulfatase activity